MSALIAAELLKLRSTRTAALLLAATLGLTGLAVAAAVVVGADSRSLDLESDRGVRTVLHVSASGGLFVLVLGVILTAGEYRHGTFIDTFLTTPNRARLTAAKVAVGLGSGVVFGALSALVALAAANHAYQLEGFSFPLDSGEAWSILTGAVGYAALFGALGAATGGLLRNQVAAIVGWLAWMFVIESIVLQTAPGIGRWLPASAGRALVRDPADDLVSQPIAALVLIAYAAAFVLLAVLAERTRDA
jgi:ABC-2 type transport system permease protein